MIHAAEPSSAPARAAPRRARPALATRRFYRRCLLDIQAGGFDVLVGGGYALERLLGAGRSTRDLDLFVQRRHVKRLLRHLEARGYEIERLFPEIERAVGSADFGRDALAKARSAVEKTRAAIASKSTNDVSQQVEQLGRTLRMFKGVVTRG